MHLCRMARISQEGHPVGMPPGQVQNYGECQRSRAYKVKQMGGILGKALMIELAAIPGRNKELDGAAERVNAAGETARLAS